MDGHIYIFVPDPQTHGPHGQTCKCTDGYTDGRTDTQKHGRTRRSTDGHAEARMQTQTHGRRHRNTDADADARTQSQAPDGAGTLNICACSAWVEKSSRRRMHPASGRTHKDLRGVLYFFLFLSTLHGVYTRDCSCHCVYSSILIIHVIMYIHPYLLHMSLCILSHTFVGVG